MCEGIDHDFVAAVELSLFVEGAAFRDIWNEGPTRNVFFQDKMLVPSATCNLSCEGGCGLMVSCCEGDRPRIVHEVSSVFSKFSLRFWTVIFRGTHSI